MFPAQFSLPVSKDDEIDSVGNGNAGLLVPEDNLPGGVFAGIKRAESDLVDTNPPSSRKMEWLCPLAAGQGPDCVGGAEAACQSCQRSAHSSATKTGEFEAADVCRFGKSDRDPVVRARL